MLENDGLGVVDVDLAFARGELTIPPNLIIDENLNFKDALRAVKNALVVVPDFHASDLEHFVEAYKNFETTRRFWQVAKPHLLLILRQLHSIDEFVDHNFRSIALIAYHDTRSTQWDPLSLIVK